MAARIRGLDITVKVAVAGVLRHGLFKNVTTFTRNNRQDLPETELLGQQETELDFIHNGYDLQWTAQQEDADAMDFVDTLVQLQIDRSPIPPITISAEYRYRDPGIQDRLVVYRDCKMKEDSESFARRSDFVENTFSAKAKRRTVMALPA